MNDDKGPSWFMQCARILAANNTPFHPTAGRDFMPTTPERWNDLWDGIAANEPKIGLLPVN